MKPFKPEDFEAIDTSSLEWLTAGILAAAHGAPELLELDGLPPALQHLGSAANELIERTDAVMRRSEIVALQDVLTRLPNRVMLRRFVEAALRETEFHDDIHVALVYIDLDRFKAVNDSLGHAQGDRLLQLATERIKAVLDQFQQDDGAIPHAASGRAEGVETMFARIGGDEFAVAMIGKNVEDATALLTRRILRILREPFPLSSTSVTIGASVGWALAPMDGTNYEDLLQHADTAMYHAKEQGRNQARRFHISLNERAKLRIDLSTQLRRALCEDEFMLYLQPQFRVIPGHAGQEPRYALVSAEALLRWRHPTQGLILPGAFIGVAEELNLIGDIGHWVVAQATKMIASWHRQGLALRLAINMSPAELASPMFLDDLRAWLEDTAAPAHLLELEITETHVMSENSLVHERMLDLRRLGISLAIDDFGTGYSNLSRLSELPVDRLKLDRSLIRDIAVRGDHRAIVQSMLHLASGLGLDVIAEGIETPQQARSLVEMGCETMQGYLFGRPVPEAEFLMMATSEHLVTDPPAGGAAS
jgi:diguanylate cyclase